MCTPVKETLFVFWFVLKLSSYSPEILPYRRADYTAQRDESVHSYFCSHGYVCARVDMRGSGDSEGFYYDEYEKQEQDDCCDVINWVSQQPWCTGNVGRLADLVETIILFSQKTYKVTWWHSPSGGLLCSYFEFWLVFLILLFVLIGFCDNYRFGFKILNRMHSWLERTPHGTLLL